MKHYLHISFKWSRPHDPKTLESMFNNALDWVRYAPNCWIVWTSNDAAAWYERVRHHMIKADNVFICKLDLSENNGWLPKFVWDWLNKKRV